MEQCTLGTTGIKVSKICLGTMTWGEQNTLEQAHAQLDYALAHSVNFIDTTEMYPVPPCKETYTRTEQSSANGLPNAANVMILCSPVKLPVPQQTMPMVWILTFAAVTIFHALKYWKPAMPA